MTPTPILVPLLRIYSPGHYAGDDDLPWPIRLRLRVTGCLRAVLVPLLILLLPIYLILATLLWLPFGLVSLQCEKCCCGGKATRRGPGDEEDGGRGRVERQDSDQVVSPRQHDWETLFPLFSYSTLKMWETPEGRREVRRERACPQA